MKTTNERIGRKYLCLSLALLGALIAACDHDEYKGNTGMPEAIAAANKEIADAIGRGDAAAVASHYSADAMIAPPEGDVISGSSEAVQKFWQAAFDGGLKGLVLETTNLETYTHVANELGRFIAKGADDSVLATGKYLVIWNKDDATGQWKIHRDIWNDAPTPAVEAVPAAPSGQ